MCVLEKRSRWTGLGNPHLSVVVLDANLLLTDGAPKLDGELGNVLIGILHAQDGQAEQGLLHVEAHVVIVEGHDAVQAAVGALLYPRVLGLGGLADDLHDVVALALVLEVVADKLERVAQGGDGGQADLGVGLLLAGTLDDGGQDGVGVGDQGVAQGRVLALADEADGGEGGLLLVGVALADVAHQGAHQVIPLAEGQLDGGDGGDDLGGGLAGLGVAGVEGLQRQGLDACLGVLVRLLDPFLLELRLAGIFAGCEGVLQGETGGESDLALCALVGELLDEGCQVEGLCTREQLRSASGRKGGPRRLYRRRESPLQQQKEAGKGIAHKVLLGSLGELLLGRVSQVRVCDVVSPGLAGASQGSRRDSGTASARLASVRGKGGERGERNGEGSIRRKRREACLPGLSELERTVLISEVLASMMTARPGRASDDGLVWRDPRSWWAIVVFFCGVDFDQVQKKKSSK